MKRACIECRSHRPCEMMEPSQKRRGTPKAWGSPCKKREGFSTWKGRSRRLSEWGGGSTHKATKELVSKITVRTSRSLVVTNKFVD
jgi:hypothetical protein